MPAKTTRRKPAPPRPRVLTGTVFITRQVHFNSAHRLYNPTKSQAWNTRQYGLCSNPHWHGHNYVLEVTVFGRPDPDTADIVDLGELKRILHRAVVDQCDHRNLNGEVGFLRGIIRGLVGVAAMPRKDQNVPRVVCPGKQPGQRWV